MEIQELHLKHFGKFEDRHFYLNDGIQIFYGENEFGKTTIYQFIKAMLFGLEPGRGRGVKTSEYKRYEPWENPNYYAGAMRFTCGGRHFYLERNFDTYQKNAKLICEDDGEELSVEDGDLEVLLDDVSKAAFENTAAIGQMKVEPGKTLAESLEDYAANYSAVQAENLRVNEALGRLKEEKKKAGKELEKEESARREKRRQIRMQQEYLERQKHSKQERFQEVSVRLKELERDQKAREERKQREQEECNRQIREELYQKNQEESQRTSRLDAEKNQNKNQNQSQNRKEDHETIRNWNRAGGLGVIIVFLCLCLVGMILAVTDLFALRIPGMILSVAAGVGCLILWLHKKKEEQERNLRFRREKGEVEIRWQDREKAAVTEEQRKRLHWKSEELTQEIRELSRELENLREEEEELLDRTEREKNQMQRIRALDLAAERMMEIARETARDFRTEFQQSASEILCEITNGAYPTLRLEENGELRLYDEHRILRLYQVSEGTAQQAYFAFRMAAAKVLLPADFPLILDETFACYDDNRLKSALKWLRKQERQVIIFSCQKREREVLDTL